ncbi:IPT/TIG domain-containing protein [Geodermatophilus sp. SYSU D01062]
MAAELLLQSAHLTDGVERVAWWNGRVLTAEDLSDVQRATDLADRRLGRALGPGVARGLTVTRRPDRRSLDLTAGLAVDVAGDVLELTAPVVLRLVRPPGTERVAGSDFVVCVDRPAPVSSTGGGAYLLTIATATGTRGSAPGAAVHGAPTAPCGPRYEVTGVQFRLVPLDVTGLAVASGHDSDDLAVLATAGADVPDPRVRNVLAHLLLDSVPRARAALDPFGPPEQHLPALQRLTAAGVVRDCEVPLAVVTWAGGGVDVVDCWAVRRTPSGTPTDWPAVFAGPAGAAAGLATLSQFAAQLSDLAGPGVPEAGRTGLAAKEVFRYLPPAVLVPVSGSSARQGVDLAVFLDGLDVRGGASIAAGRVWPLVAASLTAPVIDLDVAGVLRTYTVDEAVDAATGRPFVLVTADFLRHLAVSPPEDTDRLVITGVSPPGDHQVGAEITVHGRNFALPAERNTVTVGGIPVVAYNPGTSDTALVFNLPEVLDVPRVAPVVVANDRGVAEWLISVVPRIPIPEGTVVFTEDLGGVSELPIEEGDTYTFLWQVEARTDVAATYRFRPVFTGAVGVPVDEWQAAASVVDAAGAADDHFELRPHDPDVPGSGPVPVGIRLTVPVGASTVQLALACECLVAPAKPELNRSSAPLEVVVGEMLTASDPRVEFDPPTLTAGGRVDPDGALVLPVGRSVRFQMITRPQEDGRFRFTAQVQPAAAGLWSLERANPAPGEEVAESAGGERRFAVTLLASGEETDPSRVLRVRVMGTPTAGGGDYVSFIRFFLRTQ